MSQLYSHQRRADVRPQNVGIKSKHDPTRDEGLRVRVHQLRSTAEPRRSFGQQLREIRQRWVGKQFVLAKSVGCTEAAICFWEGNRRLPTMERLERLEHFLTGAGVPLDALSQLKAAHREAVLRRTERSAALRHDRSWKTKAPPTVGEQPGATRYEPKPFRLLETLSHAL